MGRSATDELNEVIAKNYFKLRKITLFESETVSEIKALREFVMNKDTRTFCILIVSLTEDALKRTFVERWNLKTASAKNEFFGSNGPLGTFAQRLSIATAMGWLPSEIRQDSGLLRKIRNEFAHNHRVHSLLQEPLRSFASDLTPIDEAWRITGLDSYKEAHENAPKEVILRIRVFCAALKIISDVLARSRLIHSGMSPEYRHPAGYEGLMEVEQRLGDESITFSFDLIGAEQ